MNSAFSESPLWTSTYKLCTCIHVCSVCFTYKAALVRTIQKGVLCLCFPVCLLFYLSFYLKIVHSNSTALSSQQYICICTCIATNPTLLPFVLCKRSPEKKPQAVAGTSLNTYTVPRATVTGCLGTTAAEK